MGAKILFKLMMILTLFTAFFISCEDEQPPSGYPKTDAKNTCRATFTSNVCGEELSWDVNSYSLWEDYFPYGGTVVFYDEYYDEILSLVIGNEELAAGTYEYDEDKEDVELYNFAHICYKYSCNQFYDHDAKIVIEGIKESGWIWGTFSSVNGYETEFQGDVAYLVCEEPITVENGLFTCLF